MENKIKLSITSPVGATLITSGKYCDSDIEVIPYLQEKTVTESGEVLPDEGYAGLSKVIINVNGAGTIPIYDGAASGGIVPAKVGQYGVRLSNIWFGEDPPEDTTKLWAETNVDISLLDEKINTASELYQKNNESITRTDSFYKENQYCISEQQDTSTSTTRHRIVGYKNGEIVATSKYFDNRLAVKHESATYYDDHATFFYYDSEIGYNRLATWYYNSSTITVERLSISKDLYNFVLNDKIYFYGSNGGVYDMTSGSFVEVDFDYGWFDEEYYAAKNDEIVYPINEQFVTDIKNSSNIRLTGSKFITYDVIVNENHSIMYGRWAYANGSFVQPATYLTCIVFKIDSQGGKWMPISIIVDPAANGGANILNFGDRLIVGSFANNYIIDDLEFSGVQILQGYSSSTIDLGNDTLNSVYPQLYINGIRTPFRKYNPDTGVWERLDNFFGEE